MDVFIRSLLVCRTSCKQQLTVYNKNATSRATFICPATYYISLKLLHSGKHRTVNVVSKIRIKIFIEMKQSAVDQDVVARPCSWSCD